ncbi:MAG: hypothetical protein ACUVWN_12565 [bacterium]
MFAKKLKKEEKEAIVEKLREEGIDLEERKPIKISLTDEEKEKLKQKIAESQQHKYKLLDKELKAREKKKKE